MITINGDNITFYQGETPDVRFDVVDSAGVAYDLTGGAAVLSYIQPPGAVVNMTGTISTTTVTVSFTHAVTQLMNGVYAFQLMCRNAAGKIVMVRDGVIEVLPSINPDAVAPT